MPISYKLTPLCEAIADSNKKANCHKARSAKEYCTKRLKNVRNDVTDCQEANEIECLWDADCKTGVCVNSKCSLEAKAQPIAWRSDPSLCLTVHQFLLSRWITIDKCSGQ